MDKVTLPREIAEAIEEIRNKPSSEYWTADIKIDLLDRRFLNDAHMEWNAVTTINDFIEASIENTATYWHAVKYGYEIELTPEDKVAEFYKKHSETDLAVDIYTQRAIVNTLDLLGIKIKGVNDLG